MNDEDMANLLAKCLGVIIDDHERLCESRVLSNDDNDAIENQQDCIVMISKAIISLNERKINKTMFPAGFNYVDYEVR